MKAVLLDFNGTLFFDSGFHEEAWGKIYRELHENSDNEPGTDFYCGPRNDIIIQKIAPWLSAKERIDVSIRKEALYRQICMENPHRVQLVHGASEFLDQMKERKVPFILASASIKDNIDFYFKTFNLDKWFSKEQCVYDDGTYNDKGDMHIEAAARLGFDLKDCIVIEDSISALTHAKENGAGTIIAIGNDGTREKIMKLGVDYFIYDFTEVNLDEIL